MSNNWLSFCWFLLPKNQTSWPDTYGPAWLDLSLCPFHFWHITPSTLLWKHTVFLTSHKTTMLFHASGLSHLLFSVSKMIPVPSFALDSVFTFEDPKQMWLPGYGFPWAPQKEFISFSVLSGHCRQAPLLYKRDAPRQEWAYFWPTFKSRCWFVLAPLGSSICQQGSTQCGFPPPQTVGNNTESHSVIQGKERSHGPCKGSAQCTLTGQCHWAVLQIKKNS